jgi:hypothetical protein
MLKSFLFTTALFLIGGCTDLELQKNSKPAKESTIGQSVLIITRPIGVPAPTNLDLWLTNHPVIATSIKWQFQSGTSPDLGAYEVTNADKISWPSWSVLQKSQLATAFADAYQWYYYNYANGKDPIPTIPNNDIVNTGYSPGGTAICYVLPNEAWDIFRRWVAHALFIEIYHIVPWSVTTYNAESLSLLFDSSRIMRMLDQGRFVMGYDNYGYSPQRHNLVGLTLISAPIYTYKFLKNNNILPVPGIIATNKKTVIKNLLLWCSKNMSHMEGGSDFQNAINHWQYVGPPPFVKIVEGTTSPLGFAHWTAGCGGTSSFLSHALRAVNIPVQLATVCDGFHYVPLFPTEKLFMDHGDNPYNSDFKNSGLSTEVLLLNDVMFAAYFGDSYYSNLNPNSISCDNVGYTIKHIYE